MGVFKKSSWVTAYFQVKMLFIAVPTLNLYSVGCYTLQCRQDMCGTVFACSGLC